MLSRRLLLSTGAGLAACARLAAAVKPIRITAVDLYEVSLPVSQTEAEAGVMYRYQVAEVRTDAGVTGYSFAGHPPAALPHLRQLLVGRDLFAVEQLVHDGLYRWGGVEHALWDAIGKVARQPVYKLLGGSRTSVRAYLTCVWKGNPDQSQVPYREQAAMAARIQKAGFKGMKIRAWRPYPLDDAEACAVVKAAVGADFHLMFDRTAHAPEVVGQKVWPYEIGLKVARALQKNGAYWLEEPFARDDFESPARLAREVDILITGGEGYVGLDSFRQCLLHQTYDILQPEGRGSGHLYRAQGRHPGRVVPRPCDPPRHHGTHAGRLAERHPGHRRALAGGGPHHPAPAAPGAMGPRAEGAQDHGGLRHPQRRAPGPRIPRPGSGSRRRSPPPLPRVATMRFTTLSEKYLPLFSIRRRANRPPPSSPVPYAEIRKGWFVHPDRPDEFHAAQHVIVSGAALGRSHR